MSPGNLQNSSVPVSTVSFGNLSVVKSNSIGSSSSLLRRISTFSFSGIKEQLQEKKINKIITYPIKLIIKLKKEKKKKDLVGL